KYDLIITSAGWYVTKGVGVFEICYCHTPPRYLYGYQTSINWQKYWPVRIYAAIVNHFMRLYDFKQAQKVNYFIANSENVKQRIKKFYRRDSVVIYPPVTIHHLGGVHSATPEVNSYFLIVSRIVGGKGLEMAIRAANKLKFPLKVVGSPGGYGREYQKIKKLAGPTVEFLGFVEDSELVELYRNAKGFLALAQDEDFGITPVEAMMAGTPVVAYRGGGYVESIIGGKTGLFFVDYSVDALVNVLRQFNKVKFNRSAIAKYAQKFSKERFKKEIKDFVSRVI
ncbi:glycosyltransferase, partial [Candidatus Microgenomates bacterium]|nr:glycosyltransferase [Candidatus Microgenomates bacterium]